MKLRVIVINRSDRVMDSESDVWFESRSLKFKVGNIEFLNLTRWSRVLRDTAASQLNDMQDAGAFARLGIWLEQLNSHHVN